MTYALAAVVDAVRDSDFKRFFPAVQPLLQGDRDLWPAIARAIEGLDPSSAFRRKMLESWITYGDGYRNAISDDLTLMRLLSLLLPRYQGGPLTLFRGEGAPNRRHRTYGMSWTTDRKVAEYFAETHRHHYIGGSVLLETDAPPDAIICAPHQLGDDYAEAEYIIDRRRLGAVRVLARFRELEVA